MTELSLLDAVEQAGMVRRGEASPLELVDAAIERIEALNPDLNAVVSTSFGEARARARALEGSDAPLAGVPYLLKDLVIERAGTPFTEGSRFLRGFESTYTSELARRLEQAGLVVLGRTNAPEFGMAPACEPVLHGPTRNPWSLEHSTSGSSGGSAAAVASGMVPIAHANDLGGSIRYPAAACALFGLKPTRGRVPLGPEYGDALGGWAIEHAVTRTVRDNALLLDLTAGPEVGDPYPAPPLARPLIDEVGTDPGRLRIAWSPRTAGGEAGDPACVAALEEAVALLESLGHDLVERDLPGLTPQVGAAIGTMFNAATAWIVAYWIRRLGREPGPDDLEPLTRAFWEAGRGVGAGEYLLAVGDTQAFARVVAGFLGEFHAFLSPTMSAPPARIGWITSTADEPFRALERGGGTVAYSGVVANICGSPAMSVPMSWTGDGLPLGVHFLGRFGDEATLVRLASQIEAARPWRDRLPPVHAVSKGSAASTESEFSPNS